MGKNIDIHHSLIESCKSGDTRALNDIYNLYSQAMFAVCLRIVNDRFEAEDILQESFISAFKNLDSYRSEATFGAWLKRIVINKSLNQIKKKKLELSEIDERIHGETPEEKEEEEEIKYSVDDIKSAVKKLPEGYRVIFSLYMFEDFSHQQIADELNITVSTSKSQLHRSKTKLKELIINSNSYGRQA